MNKNKKNSNKKSRILNIFSKIVGIIYLIVYILSVFLLVKLDVLPNKYLIPFLIISILFSINKENKGENKNYFFYSFNFINNNLLFWIILFVFYY